ncbi:MAG: DUF4439 domain-containing protein [Propionibacteriales bacterium]|nr:DUF4439 domain-containing protein [Propionibacteriales bacterium]
MTAGREALQRALAAEHAAVYGYGVVGGVLGEDSSLATTGYADHRGHRDRLIELIGADAVAAEPAYQLPFRVSNERQAERLGIEIEHRCAKVYAGVVSQTTGKHRMLAARSLAECAVRALDWGADPEPFPGLGD